jgi:hypothetical protein
MVGRVGTTPRKKPLLLQVCAPKRKINKWRKKRRTRVTTKKGYLRSPIGN